MLFPRPRGLYATLGRRIADDFGEFGWAQCLVISKLNNWGPLTTNMLFIGEPGKQGSDVGVVWAGSLSVTDCFSILAACLLPSAAYSFAPLPLSCLHL